MAPNNDIAIYEGPGGRVEVRVERETVWLPLAQIADLFGVNVPAISKHVKNIYAARELDPAATVSKMETVRQEGKRRVTRSVEFCSLDMIISVGYRVNSAHATRFRIWATRTLKEHLARGYTLNRQRLEPNARELEAALKLVQCLDESSVMRNFRTTAADKETYDSQFYNLDVVILVGYRVKSLGSARRVRNDEHMIRAAV